MKALNDWLVHRWNQFLGLRRIIHETRFSFFVVVISVAALLLNEQGREIAVRGGDSTGDFLWYPLATLWLATQAWFWARIILSARYPRPRDKAERNKSEYRAADLFPRLLATVSCAIPIVALSAAIADGQAGDNALGVLIVLAVSSALLLAFIVFRRDLTEWTRENVLKKSVQADPDSGTTFIIVSVVLAALMTAVAWFRPLQFGATVGAAPMLMLGLASVVTGGSLLVYLTRNSSFPTVTLFVVSSVALSSCDPHFMRRLEPLAAQDPRPTLVEEFRRWHRLAGPDPTLVVVGASGGGITAAYWTSSLLAQFNELDPRFASRLFAISSVSGGSVGAATFSQALNCPQSPAEARRSVAHALDDDLLAPVIGSALFADTLFWTPGPSILAAKGWRPPDRAVTFEAKLEDMWRASFPETCAGLDQSFLGQRGLGDWRPILLLNSAHQETGRPVLQSQVRLSDAGRPYAFETAIDLFTVSHEDLRLSTAALNSARFPLVSPAGQIAPAPGEPPLALGHLIDGGYFENDGAFTMLQVFDVLRNELADVRVVVIQISIDAPLPFEPNHKTSSPPFIADQVAHQPHFGNDLLAPLYGFFATRAAHQADARDRLRAWTLARGDKGIYVHFRALIPREGRDGRPPAEPPLGWLLSHGSQEQLREHTLCLDRNHAQWEILARALGIPATRVQACGPSRPQYRDVDEGVLPP